MPYILSQSLGLLIYLFKRVDKNHTLLAIKEPDIKGLSVNLNSGGELKLANKIKRALALSQSTVVSI
jgi:hypothetical protein